MGTGAGVHLGPAHLAHTSLQPAGAPPTNRASTFSCFLKLDTDLHTHLCPGCHVCVAATSDQMCCFLGGQGKDPASFSEKGEAKASGSWPRPCTNGTNKTALAGAQVGSRAVFFMGWRKELVRARAGHQSQSSWPGVGLEGGQDAGPSCAGCCPRLALLRLASVSSIEGGDTALESQRLSQAYSHMLCSCIFWGVLAFLTLSEVGQLLISQGQQSSKGLETKGLSSQCSA